MRTPFKIALVVAVLLLAVVLSLIGTIPARSRTASRMKATMLGILTFAHEHDKLPLTLAALPATDGNSLKTEDAWNRPLDYTFDAAGIVTLGSLGADKRPGGNGDNRDMVGTFNTRDSRGDWQKEFLQWKDDPLTE